MAIVFNEELHEYRLDGRVLPSVTQVLRGCFDFSRVDPAVIDAKAQFGKAVHLACELDDAGDLDESTVHPKVLARLDAYRAFKQQKSPRVIANELVVHSASFGFAGKLDLLCDFDDARWVIDWKTPDSIHPAVALQTAGYAGALPREMRGYGGCQDMALQPLRRAALQLCDDGRYRLHEFVGQMDWPVFLAKVMSFTWDKANLK